MKNVKEILEKLSSSSFRASFHLKQKDIDYYHKLGEEKIKSHAYDFIFSRLAPAYPKNDGNQTPMKNHPVFIAQHATATCCRSCLEKWHSISKGKALTKDEIDYIVVVIMAWIKKDIGEI